MNNGVGTCRDVTVASGISQAEPGHGFATVYSDDDEDEDQDLYVENDRGP